MEIQQLLAEHVPDLDPQYQSMWTRDLGQVVSRGQNTLAEVSARLKADKPGFGDFPRPRDWIKRMEGAGRQAKFQTDKTAETEAAADEKLTPAQHKQREVDEAVRLKLEEARSIE